MDTRGRLANDMWFVFAGAAYACLFPDFGWWILVIAPLALAFARGLMYALFNLRVVRRQRV